MTSDTEIRATLPLKQLRESPLNPRRNYPDGPLRELAASMSLYGCLHPLMVRPMPAGARLVKGEWQGLKHFEIVAGHRRFRAAAMAHFRELPVTIRHLSDAQAKALMLVENIGREDLTPSEEAASLAELVTELGLEGASERVGKPESYVRERAALAHLPAWFLAAVDAKLVPASTAAVVAKVPGNESREKAAVCVAAGLVGPGGLGDDWRDEWFDESGEDGPILRSDYAHVLTQREAKELVRTHFCRELKGSPFSRKALDLVPEAGSCDACPKRAGNDPELLADGVRADTCTDPECYAKKVAAYREAEVAKATAKGVLDADLGVSGFERSPRGWCRLDAPLNQTELLPEYGGGSKHSDALTRPMGKLLGDDCPQRYYAFGRGEKLVLLVKTAEARKVLVAAGVLKKPDRKPAEKREKAPPKPAAKLGDDWRAKERVVAETARLTARILAEYGADNFEDLDPLAAGGGPETNAAYEALVLVARLVAADWCVMGEEREAAVVGLLGIEGGASPARRTAVVEKLTGLSPRQLLGFLLGACGAAAVGDTHLDGTGKLADAFLAYAELDREALESQARRIVAGEESADAKVDAALESTETPAAGGILGDPSEWKDLAPGGLAKKTPGTVGRLDSPPPSTPVVCAPVGAGKLKDIRGLTAQDAACLAAVGLNTLADLERACDAVRAAHSNPDHYPGGIGSQLYEVLRKYPGAFTPGDVTRIGDAVVDHLTVAAVPPAAKKAAKKATKAMT